MFSQLWEIFQAVCPDPEFQKVVNAISKFGVWSSLASTTELNLTNDHLKKLCCPKKHVGENCCSTFALIKSLELLGGFGSSVTVHVLAQHTGCFAWHHRILGAMAEEGLESLHSTIKGDIENVARGDLVERARIAIQRWGVQIQLADLGKNVD
uniref:Uncharacterized protein n=1 Tax=Acrobeloides nanus TaxID=290746 RepID=A0A914DFE5_9BILA